MRQARNWLTSSAGRQARLLSGSGPPIRRGLAVLTAEPAGKSPAEEAEEFGDLVQLALLLAKYSWASSARGIDDRRDALLGRQVPVGVRRCMPRCWATRSTEQSPLGSSILTIWRACCAGSSRRLASCMSSHRLTSRFSAGLPPGSACPGRGRDRPWHCIPVKNRSLFPARGGALQGWRAARG